MNKTPAAVNYDSKLKNWDLYVYLVMYSGHLGDWYIYWFQCPKNNFQVLSFHLYFNNKYVKLMINDFTMVYRNSLHCFV